MVDPVEPAETNASLPEEAAAKIAAARQDMAVKRIETRRQSALNDPGPGSQIKIEGHWRSLEDETNHKHFINKCRVGLALSGGGIRSSTISLGLVEALASRGRFYSFDMMSTVSGGGYLGSFVRSMFVERDQGFGRAENEAVVGDRINLADATLNSLPDQQYFRGERDGQSSHSPFIKKDKTVKNPLWWLRENGRYLAPGGMADYLYALSYIVRNWVSLLLFVLAVLLVGFAGMQLMLVGAASLAKSLDPVLTWQVLDWLQTKRVLTPLVPVLGLMGLIGTGIAAGFWLSLPLPFSRASSEEDSSQGRAGVFLVVLGLLAALLIIFLLESKETIPGDDTAIAWAFALKVIILATLGSAFAVVVGRFVAVRKAVRRGLAVTKFNRVDFRREQTRLLSHFNGLFLALCAIAIIDRSALWLRASLRHNDIGDLVGLATAGLGVGGFASVVSFLIAKLPGWIGEDGGGWRKLILAHSRQAALISALAILASLALMADLLALKLLWKGDAWIATGQIAWGVFTVVVGAIALLTVLFGRSVNFANLLALTPFYGSRLTRTYLGGGNFHRLDIDSPSEVTHGLIGDDIAIRTYMEDTGPAPLHLINITRNRTKGERIAKAAIDLTHDDHLVREDTRDPRGRLASYESSLTIYDRHGDRMVFGPFGVRVGAEFFEWDELEDAPSLGLLCAISGAAVGSGMGRNTSLGTAMAMTLANVRLGYWWKARCRPEAKPAPDARPFWRRLTKQLWGALLRRGGAVQSQGPGRERPPLLPGLSCLMKEMLGKFDTRHFWHLSDGGHSENSGALSLLERGCEFILVSDNAQDPAFSFCDLEIFIRTARTDIGMEVTVAKPKQFPASLTGSKAMFFNGVEGDWRKRVKAQNDEAFALLLMAQDIPLRAKGKWTPRKEGASWIVWLKPNCFANLPADIATYAEINPDFPQQSTSNQFFGEAQWESYRRLGFEMGRRLFADPDTLAEYLPIVYRKTARD